jgi:DNA-binding NarL/FixJ family response regulator
VTSASLKRTTVDGSGLPVTRLLLVDDHPVLRAGIKLLLSAEEDLEVVGEVDDGLKAVEFARDHAVDVIIMDVSLPQLTGPEATKNILGCNPAQRVLVFSSHEDASLARQLLAWARRATP